MQFDVIIGNRVSAEVEMEGLDLPEMGALAYPEFALAPGPGGHLPAAKMEVTQRVLEPVRGTSAFVFRRKTAYDRRGRVAGSGPSRKWGYHERADRDDAHGQRHSLESLRGRGDSGCRPPREERRTDRGGRGGHRPGGVLEVEGGWRVWSASGGCGPG